MGIAQEISIVDTESFSVPEYLAEHYNKGTIDYEQMAVLAAKHYAKESSSLVADLGAKTALAENLQAELTGAVVENATLSAQIEQYQHQELALAMARKEIADLSSSMGGSEALRGANKALALELQSHQKELALKSTAIANAANTEKRNKALIIERDELQARCDDQASKINRLESLAVAHDTSANELRNAIKTAKANNERLLATISEVKAELKTEKATAEELRALIKDNSDSVGEAKAAINTVAKSILVLDKNQKALDKENRHLSLYVSAHTASPIFETPQGHQLKALMFDKNQIVSSGGKEAIEEGTALFQWVNPNGFACLVALSADTSKGELLLLPSLVDESIAGRLTPTGKKVAKNLTDAIAPPKEYYEIIARHIKDFSVEEFKKAMLKAFARATYLTNETEHLVIDNGDQLAQGELAAFKEMADSHDRVLSRNLLRRKQALRPKSKSSKNKKRK